MSWRKLLLAATFWLEFWHVAQAGDCQSVTQVTLDQFKQAVQWRPSRCGDGLLLDIEAHYEALMLYVDESGIKTRKEFAMFLAHVIYETNGLCNLTENCNFAERCGNKPNWETICHRNDSGYLTCSVDRNGETHHCSPCNPCACKQPYIGRGYLQMSLDYNYRATSLEFFDDPNFLLEFPEIVASNLTIAARTSYWLWKKDVHPKLSCGDDFGQSSKALSSSTSLTSLGRLTRFEIYRHVMTAFGINDAPCGGKFSFGDDGPYCSSKRYILLLDTFGSTTEDDENVAQLKAGINLFIENLPVGAEFSVVPFCSKSPVIIPPTLIQNDDARKVLKAKLFSRRVAPESPCMACGISAALDILQNSTSCLDDAVMILLRAGRQSLIDDDTIFNDVLEKIKDAAITVHTIIFSANYSSLDESKMASLAETTKGGKYWRSSTSSLINYAFDSILAATECPANAKIAALKTVKWDSTNNKRNAAFSVPVDIDEAMSLFSSAVVRIDFPKNLPLTAKLMSYVEEELISAMARPITTAGSGDFELVDDSSSPLRDYPAACENDPIFPIIFCKFIPKKAGRWLVALENSSPSVPLLQNDEKSFAFENSQHELTVSLLVEPSESLVVSFDRSSTTSPAGGHHNQSLISANFLANGRPIANAIVEAKIRSSTVDDSMTWLVELRDDGLFPDNQACDGLYKGVLMHDLVIPLGYYSTEIIARNFDEKSTTNAYAKPHRCRSLTSEDFSLKIFYRTISLGSVQIFPSSHYNSGIIFNNNNGEHEQHEQTKSCCVRLSQLLKSLTPPTINMINIAAVLVAFYLVLVVISCCVLMRRRRQPKTNASAAPRLAANFLKLKNDVI